MKEHICKEVPTDNGGYLEPVNELIRCKDCKYWNKNNYRCSHFPCRIYKKAEGYCDEAKRKEE